MTVRVTLTPKLLRVRERTFEADGYSIEGGNLDLFRGERLVGTIKKGGWVSVIVEEEEEEDE